jgi:hypothetical protein
VKEQNGVFLKWDTSLTLAPNVNKNRYQLQPDVQRIVRVREFDASTGKWRRMNSTDFNDIGMQQGVFSSLFSAGDAVSPFSFYGPFNDEDTLPNGPDGMKPYLIEVQPEIDQNRPLEIVYSANFTEIEDPS